MSDHGSDPQRAKRAPGAVFSGLSVAIVAVMLAALNPSQPPPPATAEYAPEAVQQLREAPKEQTSASGSGVGGEGEGLVTPSPSPPPAGVGQATPKPIDSKRVRRCVGEPPRQTEDPQSPPCVAYWEGDNGGVTSRGVDRNSIKIYCPAECGGGTKELVLLIRNHFNSRYEFYGRKLNIVGPDCGGETPSEIKGCVNHADQAGAFASLAFGDSGGDEFVYYEGLAEKKIIGINGKFDTRTEADFAKLSPYSWGYLPSADKLQRHMAEMVCRQLEGRVANHGGAAFRTTVRKLGLITNTYESAPSSDIRPLKTGLKACGVEPEHREILYPDEYPHANDTSAQQAANALASFNLNRVTTVTCLCHANTLQQLYGIAEAQSYEPEWLISSYIYLDENYGQSGNPQNQVTHVFGVSVWNKHVPPVEQPWFRAVAEQKPSYNYENNPFVYFGARLAYHQMVVLASGIQMAGPNLTPETFREGLWKAQFPNPDHPTYPGKVGFDERDHTLVNDAALIWWDPTSRDPWLGGQGAFCYVSGGTRFNLGSYPSEDLFFATPTCPG